MTSGILAAFVAVLVWGFIEAFGRFYPAKRAWWRLRRARGRTGVRAMRERFEAAAGLRASRILAAVLVLAVVAWVAAAGPLDKRWYEVLLDATPSIVVMLAALRIPRMMRAVAARMRDYERDAGEDPDAPLDDGGEGDSAAVL